VATSKSNRRVWTLTTIGFVLGVVVGATSAVQVAPQFTTSQAAVGDTALDPTAPGVGSSLGPIDNPTAGEGGTGNQQADDVVASQFECAPGRNGGATDVGVTDNSIRLATTVVQSGHGASFLGEVRFAMEAVKNKVNREGGICGRLLDIQYVDDAWDAARGAEYLKNFIQSGVFAIPVGASSEGLGSVITTDVIAKAGIPVVGTDGLVLNQYTEPWVWPVAVATVSSARIMARNAFERGATNFSIVFDKNYKFGVEAAEAYNNEVRRLTGSNVKGYNKQNNCDQSFCGILPKQSSYTNEVNRFDDGDFMAMFLEPTTALTWMGTAGSPKPSTVTYGIGAAQPLFTRNFAENCQKACNGMWVWTGYRPPIEAYKNETAVRRFVTDMQQTKPDADIYNAFSMGGYTGMELLVSALKKVGPYLTRARLLKELDSMNFGNGLTIQKKLDWRGSHFANATMQAFEIGFSTTFSGWRAGVIVRDPTPERGKD